ncbi:MAG TPA: sugar ABC transporter permease [Ktedonobacteraceae bacterium]
MQLIAKNNALQKGTQRPNWHSMFTPWIWIAPTIIMVAIFLFYPMLNTIWLSFFNANSSRFVGLDNYRYIFTSPNMLTILKNNLLWLVLGTTATIAFGLVIAVLVDRVRFESQVKAAIFVPMAISLVGAGVIWRFIYQYSAPNQPQIGLLNAIVTSLGGQPQAWLITPGNNIALIAAYVWMWTGFCMVILSAALKSIPSDILEAARTDGASSLTIFLRITVPMISPTIAVVATTMIINILKIFDIIYVMTGGNYHTSVVAVEFYQQVFNFNRFGVGSALTVLLLIAVIPIMIINTRLLRIHKGQ